jgi:hypothetical protein
VSSRRGAIRLPCGSWVNLAGGGDYLVIPQQQIASEARTDSPEEMIHAGSTYGAGHLTQVSGNQPIASGDHNVLPYYLVRRHLNTDVQLSLYSPSLPLPPIRLYISHTHTQLNR